MAVDDLSANLADVLRDLRRAAGLTQERLAERAGVSPRSISELERGGAHIPRRDTVSLLARALGLVGSDREAFEALVDSRRRPRARRVVEQASPRQVPTESPDSVERTKHNLPRVLSSFVGREQELAELAGQLVTAPVLTLVGPGGVGKTRLAQELVRAQLARYADGGWLVELAGLEDPALVPVAVAAAVGLRDLHARDLTLTLTEFLRPKQLLLLLDNCEHLVDACADLVAHLVASCPQLQVLTTSREPLSIVGESTWRVPPLSVPESGRRLSADQLARSPAARLFVERARSGGTPLALSEETAAAVARICIRVSGIPLALELAAARVRVLTVEQLADRLEYDSGLLGGGDRAGVSRHHTIRATLDWSHDLLSEQEQILLRRVSVFAGGWNLYMAEVVCSGAGVGQADVLDVLTQLVDKSMVLVDTRDSVARYRMLEPIRQYALERLEASGDAPAYRARHATVFLKLAQTGAPDPAGPDEIPSLDRLEVEHDNIRVALRWALTNQHSAAALRSAAALFHLWERRGRFQEGCTWLEQALAAAGEAPAADRSGALNALAALYWRGGDAERARPLAEQAFTVSREDGNTRDVAWALLNLGMIAYFLGQPGLAVARLEESVVFARDAGHVPLLSVALTLLGRTLLWVKGPLDHRAAAALDESLALAEAAQSRFAAGHALTTMGDLVWQRGDTQRALPLWQQALDMRGQLADWRGIAGCLERLAWGFAANDQFAEAAWLFGAAHAQQTALAIGLRHDEETDHAHLLAVTRQQLGEAFAAAWSAGLASTLDEAVVRALEGTRWLPNDDRRPRHWTPATTGTTPAGGWRISA